MKLSHFSSHADMTPHSQALRVDIIDQADGVLKAAAA